MSKQNRRNSAAQWAVSAEGLKIMKITLFGATGPTGKVLIGEALKRGFEVTVFVRPSSPFMDDRVRVVRGDLTDEQKLTEAIRGSEAVLSALGPSSLKHPRGLPITHAIRSITSVMQWENVKRLIAISTGTAVDAEDRFDLKIRLPAILIRLMMPGAYADIIELPKVIRGSGLSWTIVRVANLTNKPASGKLNVGLYGRTKHSLTVTREDVAIFMLDQLDGRDFLGKSPGISGR